MVKKVLTIKEKTERKARRKESRHKYRKSAKGKATAAAYAKNPKAKARTERYERSRNKIRFQALKEKMGLSDDFIERFISGVFE